VRNINVFIEAFSNVMAQIGFSEIKKGNLSVKGRELRASGITVVVGIVGQIKGNIIYVIDIESAKKIASMMMMGMPVEQIDDISRSALSELTNMITANATICASKNGVSLDISTPTLFQGDNMAIQLTHKETVTLPLFADGNLIEINISLD